MKKACLLVLSLIVVCVCLVSCQTKFGQVGTLPDNWWTFEGGNTQRGALESALRNSGSGEYANVIVVLGTSDSRAAVTESLAIDSAWLDAKSQLSTYIIDKVSSVTVNLESSLTDELQSSGLSKGQQVEIMNSMQAILKSFQSSLTITQFNSFIVEAKHTEKAEYNGFAYYKGWVCCTIRDEIVEELKKIAEVAFETNLETTAAYSEIMARFQDIITAQIEQAFAEGLKGDASAEKQ
jgi:hypothetical protein